MFRSWLMKVLLLFLVCVMPGEIAAEGRERLDRGVVATLNAGGDVYVGWRLLTSDSADVVFDVFRGRELDGPYAKLNVEPVQESSNFVDAAAGAEKWFYKIRSTSSDKPPVESTPVEFDPLKAGVGFQSIPLQGVYSSNKTGIADLDGDGVYDYVINTPGGSIDPGTPRRSSGTNKIEAYSGKTGTFMWRYDLGWNIVQGIWFSPVIVYDLDGDGKAEVVAKTAPFAATPEESFISRNGFVLDGPEYCSVLDGVTGKETARVDWVARGNISDWGDDKGNRVNRNQLGVAYLDGKRPSLLVLRGTYTRMRIDAYNYIDKNLQEIWSWDGDEETPPLRGQGAHSLHVFDIDSDGRDEIIIGSAAIDDNGKCLWRMNMGHPDWMYLADVDPARDGLELAYGFESPQRRNGICLADPRTGKILWGCDHPTTHIHDWGLVADIDPVNPGMEIYGMERDGRTAWLYTAQGKLLSQEDLGRNGPRSFYWLDSAVKVRVPFSYRSGTFPVLKYPNEQIGEIKGQPVAIADCLGDWREEVITVVDGTIRIYTTTIPATSRRVCLMQDRLYRLDVAVQMMGYFYPPQIGGTQF